MTTPSDDDHVWCNYEAHPCEMGDGWCVVNIEAGDEIRLCNTQEEAERIAAEMNAADNRGE